MTENGTFKCLRCGHDYEDKYTPKVPQERTCPNCGSNSVRRIEEKKAVESKAQRVEAGFITSFSGYRVLIYQYIGLEE